MTEQKDPNGDNNVYVNKATITIRMVGGVPVAEPDVVYLKNGGEIQWCIETCDQSSCEIQFRTDSEESCPFVFQSSAGFKSLAEGCFSFAQPGEFQAYADRKNPILEEEVWEYDILVNGVKSDPVIRLKNTPDDG